MATKEKVNTQFYEQLERAVDCDSWGQIVEAVDSYRALSKKLKAESKDSKVYSDDEKKVLAKIATCLDLRIDGLENAASDGIPVEEVKKLLQTLKQLTSETQQFPVNVAEHKRKHSRFSSSDSVPVDEDDTIASKARGSLLPRATCYQADGTLLTIRIEKIGLKDAGTYIEPFISIMIRDKKGEDLATEQCTPVSNRKENLYIHFDVDYECQKPIEKLSKDCAIFFALKHYKAASRKVSTRCYAFMEPDEIKPGPACLELYEKPIDFKRKNVKLFTVKPLYLHVNLTFHTD
eukprot:Opistho-1_new@94260